VTANTTGTAGAPAQILVVDDDARVRAAVCALIESSGLPVAGEASSGTGAYQAIEALDPDIVVLDLLLPSAEDGLDVLLPSAEDGLEVLRRLVASGRPVVALSIREGLRAQAIAAGAVAFVAKYAGPDALLETLHEVVARVQKRE
jgi:CheY-like chemotaxis protein